MKENELNKMYSILSYPGDNNHENFFKRGVYPNLREKNFKRILDAGCGTGALLKQIAPLYRNSEITAVDFTESSLKKAKKELKEFKNIEFIKEDLCSISFKNVGKFDFIHCQGVLHHLEDKGQGLKNLVSCLTDDGYLYLWVYLAKGREDIKEIKELMEPFNSMEIDDKLRILRNLLSLRKSAKHNSKHKRYLRRQVRNGLLRKIGNFFIMIEEFGVFYSLLELKNRIFKKLLNRQKKFEQDDIGLADEYLNPIEYFYDLNELFSLLGKNGLKIDKIIDGISEDIKDLGNGNCKFEPEILIMPEKWKWKMIESFDKPRGIGLLCSINRKV